MGGGVVSETPGLSLPTTAGPQDTQAFHTLVSPSDRCRDSGGICRTSVMYIVIFPN